MSESDNDVVETKQAEPEYNDMEVSALSMGWKPQDQLPEGVEFIDAGEYVRRKPLFDKIDSYSKKVKHVEQSLKDLTEHHSKVRQTEYNKAYTDLKGAYKNAMLEGDTEVALNIHERMEDLNITRNNEVQAEPVVQTQQGPSPEYTEWVTTNDWYEKDTEMHDFADTTARVFLEKNGSQNERAIFKHVDQQIKRAFPEKFGNPNRDRPGAAGKSNARGKGGSRSKVSLNPEQEAIARRWERSGVMTRDQYVEELSRMEEE